ncbi:MAG: PDZ domain-containing protein, partial [Planctomycetaceae bacterium]|jgi:S1-C subfamily serine protease|nr:PDZ domain-containing protein [Planctomycetaceae bacterium]
VVITDIRNNYPGAKAGLEVGDVILTIDGKKITSEKEYSDAIDATGREMKLVVRNKRFGNTSTIIVPLTAP